MARPREKFTPAQRREMWARFKSGDSVPDIARALDRAPGAIYSVVREHGGVAPRERKRCARSLTLEDREEISRGIVAGLSQTAMAQRIGCHKSTIGREIARHGGRGHYRASEADRRAWDNTRRPQTCKLATNKRLAIVVADKLKCDWSPRQIAGWLHDEYPNSDTMRVSHETIYLTLFIQARGALKRELTAHLRRAKSERRPRAAAQKETKRGPIKNAVSISERPAEVEDRAVPGHWEGDLIEGRRGTFVATLVERHSRFCMLVKVTNKETETVTRALKKSIRRLPDELVKTLTWDRGGEMADHVEFTVATDVQVYFCDPRSPWQRGSNENTNGLLRQYLPKGSDLSVHSQRQLDEIAMKLNTRPRETLRFKTPTFMLDAALR